MMPVPMSTPAVGPLRTLRVSCLASFGGAPACRVPARRPGNFHLRPQMKVTKAKGLNATPYGSFFALRRPGPAGHLDAPTLIEATAHSTGPRCASALGPADQCGRGLARPAPPSARPARCAARSPSGPPGRASGACRTHERCCVKGLCFGDFHLAPQMKVTRPPGRDPAGWRTTRARQITTKAKVRNGPRPDTRFARVSCTAGGAKHDRPLT